jgi:2-iminoacetate synthase ThiH
MEVMNGVTRTGLSIRDFLIAAKEAGVDSLPGTAAEILDDDVRWILTKGKLPTSQWIEVVTTAHDLGIPTTSTMMYGHVDHPGHWVTHLQTLATIQAETGGLTEFVPLPFVHQSSPIYLAGVARPGPTVRDNRAVHAVARIMLHGLIDNIQCSWVKLGPRNLYPGPKRGRQRPRRHPDGGDHQPDGRVHQRFAQGRHRARGHGCAGRQTSRQRTTTYGHVANGVVPG